MPLPVSLMRSATSFGADCPILSAATLTRPAALTWRFFHGRRGFLSSHRMASPRAKPSRRMLSTASSRVNVPLPPSRARRYRSTISSSSARTLSYEDAMEEIWSGIAQRQIVRPRRRCAHRYRRRNWSSSETLSGAASLCAREELGSERILRVLFHKLIEFFRRSFAVPPSAGRGHAIDGGVPRGTV
jgi:hypothetical protein